MINIKKDIIVAGKYGKPISIDLYYPDDDKVKPIVLFAHGFKGFKDWGHWHLLATAFADAGFLFAKFNFSHNGTTPETPVEFSDLEAFGQNNYTKELSDLDVVIHWILATENLSDLNIDRSGVALIGHSRGGGVSIVKAASDDRIKKLILWASVSSLAFAWKGNPELVEKWRSDGVFHILNGRTKQSMPLYFQLYEDYQKHENIYNVEQACQQVNIPSLILQGTADPAIPVTAAQDLERWIASVQLQLLPDANHVFGGKHPYTEKDLPEHSRLLFEYARDFLKG